MHITAELKAYWLTCFFFHLSMQEYGGLHKVYSSSAVGHECAVWQVYLFEAYASNGKCLYTSTSVTFLIVLSSYECVGNGM